MLKEIVMPGAGQTTNELTIGHWLKHEGDTVARGDVLAEIETDKAVLSIESFAKGTLLKILVGEGETALVGDAIAYVGNEGDLPAESAPVPAAVAAADDYAPIARTTAPPSRESGLQSSPAAKKAARDRGLSLEAVASATGKSLLKRSDVLNYQAPAPHSAAAPMAAQDELIPLTPMRRTIARRMLESATTIPAFHLEVEVDLRAAQALRERLKARGHKFAFHDLFAKAAAAAIREHKLINASWTEEGILCHGAVNVGVAVSVEGGLVVPVVRDAGSKSLGQLASESAALIDRARQGLLQTEEMSGGTITVSNMGMYPLSHFTALINPPECCILAFGGVTRKLVLEQGVPVEIPIVAVSAAFDHRVLDGAYGAAFLSDYKALLEDPASMLY